MELLRVEGLSKNFGGLQVLVRVSFNLEAGECVAIIGPNGAGKTTLLNVLSGELSAIAGKIYLFGRDITTMPTHRRIELGMSRSYQVTNLFPPLTLLDNILLALHGTKPSRFQMFRSVTSYDGIMGRAQELLESIGLWEKKDELTQNLSHGEQRRVEIAMVMASEPKLLLLDEPSAGLTSAETDALIDKIRAARDVGVLFAAHDMDIIFGLADRIMVLYFGKIIAQGRPQEIRADPRVREIYLGVHEEVPDAGVN